MSTATFVHPSDLLYNGQVSGRKEALRLLGEAHELEPDISFRKEQIERILFYLDKAEDEEEERDVLMRLLLETTNNRLLDIIDSLINKDWKALAI